MAMVRITEDGLHWDEIGTVRVAIFRHICV
jgi:hypothetical protein